MSTETEITPGRRGRKKVKADNNKSNSESEGMVATEEKQGESVTLTMDQLQQLVGTAVNNALAQQHQAQQAQQPRARKNADFIRHAGASGVQSQEDVERLAMTVGEVDHGRGVVAAVPEWVAAHDKAEHSATINKLKAFGYVVTLDRVEFKARWEPKDKDGIYIPDKPEPESAKPLLTQLQDLDATCSRVWLEYHLNGTIIGNEQQLFRAVDRDRRGGPQEWVQRSGEHQRVLAAAEAGHIAGDNHNFDLGSNVPIESHTIA